MIIEKTQVFNFEGALRGMRNPLESWEKSDSAFGIASMDTEDDIEVLNKWIEYDFPDGATQSEVDQYIAKKLVWLDNNGYVRQCGNYIDYAFIGPNDLKLAQTLIKGGPEHCKFLRQIRVSMDVIAPRYVWSEFDTYHFHSSNSCSTMHMLLNKKYPITKELFAFDEELESIMDLIIKKLNELRDRYLKAKNSDEKNYILAKAKQILPESFLQRRTIETSYAELRNQHFQRYNHRLKDWNTDFVNAINKLPYSQELITYDPYKPNIE